MKYFSIDKV